jgi:hypothetical protein
MGLPRIYQLDQTCIHSLHTSLRQIITIIIQATLNRILKVLCQTIPKITPSLLHKIIIKESQSQDLTILHIIIVINIKLKRKKKKRFLVRIMEIIKIIDKILLIITNNGLDSTP